MIIMLCVAFFAIGYGYAYKSKIDVCNNALQEFVNEYPCSPYKGGLENGFTFNFSNFNIT